jgi:hypothetical protein
MCFADELCMNFRKIRQVGVALFLLLLLCLNVHAESIATQAGRTLAGAGVGIAGNMAMYKVFAAECASKFGAWACPLAAMSIMQVGALVTSGGESTNTKKTVTAGGSNFNDGFGSGSNPGETPGTTPEETELQLEVNSAITKLAKNGYSVNPKTGIVTTPKGKFPSAAFTNGQTMADAGLISRDQVSDVDIMINKALKDSYKVVSIGIASGGGGGSRSGQASVYQYEDPYKSLYGSREKPKDPRTAGLTRSLASGDSIGAGTDNLFEMIKRRYQKKSEEKIFVGQ